MSLNTSPQSSIDEQSDSGLSTLDRDLAAEKLDQGQAACRRYFQSNMESMTDRFLGSTYTPVDDYNPYSVAKMTRQVNFVSEQPQKQDRDLHDESDSFDFEDCTIIAKSRSGSSSKKDVKSNDSETLDFFTAQNHKSCCPNLLVQTINKDTIAYALKVCAPKGSEKGVRKLIAEMEKLEPNANCTQWFCDMIDLFAARPCPEPPHDDMAKDLQAIRKENILIYSSSIAKFNSLEGMMKSSLKMTSSIEDKVDAHKSLVSDKVVVGLVKKFLKTARVPKDKQHSGFSQLTDETVAGIIKKTDIQTIASHILTVDWEDRKSVVAFCKSFA